MSQAAIHTELDNLQFVPGETLRGRVTWLSDSAVTAAELRLFYYTAGKGTRNVGLVETKQLSPRQSSDESFSFNLPVGPYTLSGQLVSVVWALELVLEPGILTERLEFTLSPTAEAIDLYRYPIAPELDDETRAKKWLRSKMEETRSR